MLFLAMTSRQRAVSAATTAAISAGVVPTGSAPSERNFVCTSGSFSTSAKSAAIHCASAGGVLGGPATANQDVETKPGSPASAAVGTSGIDTARGRTAGLCLRSEEHTSELQSRQYLVCRLLLAKKQA